MKEKIRKARRAGVPLVAIETFDPANAVRSCLEALNGKQGEVPILSWDIVQQWVGLNKPGKNALKDWYDPLAMQLPDTLKALLEKFPPKGMAFIHNPQRIWDRDGVAQGIWLLRDALKAKSGAMLILVGPTIELPSELQQDVVVITEPLPDRETLGRISDSVIADARLGGFQIPEQYGKDRILDILLGLSAFAAEQSLALSLGKDGIDMDSLWERKRRTIEQTPGLRVWRDASERWDNLRGLKNLKSYLKKILTGDKSVRCIGFIDEIEKGIAGATGNDLSGVSQDQLQVFLTAMQDDNIPGMILVGPPGTGKSAIAKAAGGMASAEVIAIDMGAMTGSLVGESQRKIRQALSVFKTVSQGSGLFIATCNKIASLPPELRRRFSLGTFYVDLPTDEERREIWPVWQKAYSLKSKTVPPDCEGWTGAEIKACCDIASRTGMTLQEASEYIVPVCKSSAKQIMELRQMADGKFISANKPGVYQFEQEETGPVFRASSRSMQME